MKRNSILFTCEHASCAVPQFLKKNSSQISQLILRSHRGFDEGALEIAKSLQNYFSESIEVPLFSGRWSRLVIDLNRSANHPKVFSKWTRVISKEKRLKIMNSIYHPFRTQVIEFILSQLKNKRNVCHLSIHTFTPVLNGEVRNCEIGILYDPRRVKELKLARQIKKNIEKMVCENQLDQVRVRMNYPYRGTSDGHTAQLRKRFTASGYSGIELEFNQRWIRKIKKSNKQNQIFKALARAVSDSF